MKDQTNIELHNFDVVKTQKRAGIATEIVNERVGANYYQFDNVKI